MNKIITDEEKINIALYRDYEITEWREKCLILTKGEQKFVLNHLNDEEDELMKMVKLPFPAFASKYFEKYEDKFKEYPRVIREQLGYNLYLLRDYQISTFATFMIDEKEIPAATKSTILKDAFEDLNISFDSPIKVDRSRTKWQEKMFKKIYISQYIDAKEAERMKLTDHAFNDHGEYRGYCLEEKLECLNGITKTIFKLLLGCDGYYRHTKTDISVMCNHDFQIGALCEMLLPAMSKSTKEFKSKIGLVGDVKDYGNSFRVYSYEPFKKFDFEINYKYLLKNVISDEVKKVLESIPPRERRIYIASKYFYSSVKSIRNVLSLSIQEAAKYVDEIETSKMIWK